MEIRWLPVVRMPMAGNPVAPGCPYAHGLAIGTARATLRDRRPARGHQQYCDRGGRPRTGCYWSHRQTRSSPRFIRGSVLILSVTSRLSRVSSVHHL